MHRLYTGGAFLYIFYRAKSTVRCAFEIFVQAISIANVRTIARYVSLLPKRRQTHRIQHHKHRTKRHCRTRNHRVQQARHGDLVLSVEQMVARAPFLGDDVTVRQIPGGVHDLALSDAAAREEYLAALTGWLVARLGRGPARA